MTSGFESLAIGLSGVRCVEVINIMPASRCDILTPKEQRIVIERADMQARIVTKLAFILDLLSIWHCSRLLPHLSLNAHICQQLSIV